MHEPIVSELGRTLRMLSASKWGTAKEIHLIGHSSLLLDAQRKIKRFARTDRPVLITGESGVGKELFAKALYLLSSRANKPFLSVNCAQYQEGDLLVSELFGHKKGSFTGALKDHLGLFEAADGGTVFLDEIGELSQRAQAMLLRTLSEGEIKPLGTMKTRRVDVRVVAATNRPLKEMVAAKVFRKDLFYRLRYLHVHLPPIRRRGGDWRLLVRFFLRRLNRQYRERRTFTPASWELLETYHWPGNDREVRSITDLGFCLSDSQIEPSAFRDALDVEDESSGDVKIKPRVREGALTASDCYRTMLREERDFWSTVREPYMDRELNRAQVRAIVKRGLDESEGSYKRLLCIFRLEQEDYLKFMDFLRHHRLKPVGRLQTSDLQAIPNNGQVRLPASG